MTRPRRASDDELLERIDAALSTRESIDPWSLDEVAPAAGLSPAGLIKRFGSKEALLRALARRWIDRIPSAPVDVGAPLEELRSYIEQNFGTASSSAAIFGLGELLRDLWSPDSAALLREGWEKQVRYLATLLALLPLRADVDAPTAARLLFDSMLGGLYRQAVDLDPTTPTRTLDRLLEGWT